MTAINTPDRIVRIPILLALVSIAACNSGSGGSDGLASSTRTVFITISGDIGDTVQSTQDVLETSASAVSAELTAAHVDDQPVPVRVQPASKDLINDDIRGMLTVTAVDENGESKDAFTKDETVDGEKKRMFSLDVTADTSYTVFFANAKGRQIGILVHDASLDTAAYKFNQDTRLGTIAITRKGKAIPFGRTTQAKKLARKVRDALKADRDGKRKADSIPRVVPPKMMKPPVLPSPPLPPGTIEASVTGGSVDLRWDSSATATYYELYRHTSNDEASADRIASRLVSAGTGYRDSSVDVSGSYYYAWWVKACNAGGCSGFSSSAVVSSAPLAPATPLNDTGITWGGNYRSGNNNTCTSNVSADQDCHQGRDADPAVNVSSDGHAGFSFTKLGAKGQDLSADATGWVCVRDNVTGLIWETKTAFSLDSAARTHFAGKTFRWGGATAIGRNRRDRTGDYSNDWNNLVNASNTAGFCGHSDWRVPTPAELVSIVHYGRQGPTMDTDYFPHTRAAAHWTAAPSASQATHAWTFSFNAQGDSQTVRTASHHVMLVRGGVSVYDATYDSARAVRGQTVISSVVNEWPDSRYTLHGDGTVTDNRTGIMWKQCSEGQNHVVSATNCTGDSKRHNWQEALEAADTSNYAGHSDWRLPNVKELHSLVAYDRTMPAINAAIFSGTVLAGYWTSSPSAYQADESWTVNFHSGGGAAAFRSLGGAFGRPVRLVRGGH